MQVALRVAVSRVTAYVCETMPRDALLFDAPLRQVLLQYIDTTTNYLERHVSAVGDARESLRCNLCVV